MHANTQKVINQYAKEVKGHVGNHLEEMASEIAEARDIFKQIIVLKERLYSSAFPTRFEIFDAFDKATELSAVFLEIHDKG